MAPAHIGRARRERTSVPHGIASSQPTRAECSRDRQMSRRTSQNCARDTMEVWLEPDFHRVSRGHQYTCTRKHGRRGRIPFVHGACVRIWSLHANVHNGSMAACRFAIGWHGACPVGCTGVTGRVMGTPFAAANTLRDWRAVQWPWAAKCD